MIRVRRYHESGTVDEEVDPTDVSDCLGQPGALLWVDVQDPTGDDITCLTEEFGVHHLAVEDLTEPAPRPRLAMFDTHFLLSVRDCLFDGEGGFSTREVDLLFGDGWLLSVRKPGEEGDPPMPVNDVVERFERTRRLDGATDEGFLLFVFLDTIVDRFFDVSDAVEDRLEEIEDDIFADPTRVRSSGPADRSVTERLYRLRHDLIGYRRVVSPLRDAVNPLLRNEVDFLGEAAVLHLRDVYDHVLRAVEVSEAHRDLLTGALDAHLSLVSNRMNLVMKRATSWAAILVCATLVAGIYGMNFKHMPELDWRFGYPLALGSMALIAVVLYFTFKRRDWL